MDHAEPADRSVQTGRVAAGVPHLRADGHRAAGGRAAHDQCRARARQHRGDHLGRRCGAARGRPQRRHQHGRRPGADRGAAAAGAPGHRSHHPRGRGGRDRPAEQPELSGRREHLGRRRAAVRRRLHARRRRPQRSPELRQPAASLSRRTAGIPRGHQRPCRAERHAIRRVGECGDQVGHEHASRKPVRVPSRQAFQCEESVCGDRSRRKALRRWAEAQSIRRDRRRTDCPRQAVLFRRLSRHQDAPDAAGSHRLCPDRGDAGGRLHDLRVGGLPGAPGQPRRGVCRQSHRPGAFQSCCREDGRLPAEDNRSVRPDYLQPARRSR